MRATRLFLTDFGRFQSLDLALAPGLNVILGDNETGKSTLREALTLALFGDPRTSDKKVLSRARWRGEGIATNRQMALLIELTDGATHYRIVRDYAQRRALLEKIGESGPSETLTTDARTIEGWVGEQLGIGSRAYFESLCRMGQSDLRKIDHGSEFADRLQSIVTGGEGETIASEVIAALDDKLRTMRSKARGKTGRLVLIEERRGVIEAELRSSLAARERYHQAQTSLPKVEAEFSQNQKEIGGIEERLNEAKGRLDLEEERRGLEASFRAIDSRVQNLQVVRSEINSARRELGQLLEEQPRLGEISPELIYRLSDEEKRTHGIEQARTDKPRALSPRRTEAVSLIVIGIALITLGAVINFATTNSLALIGLGLIGGLLALLGALSWQRASGARRTTDDEAENEVENKSEDHRQILASFGVGSAGELKAIHDRAASAKTRLAQAGAKLEGVLSGEDEGTLSERHSQTGRQLRLVRATLASPEFALAGLDAQGYRSLEVRRRGLTEEIAQSTQKTALLRAIIESSAQDYEALCALEEELERISAEETALLESERIYSLARAEMIAARDEKLLSAGDLLERELSAMAARLTEGRYSKIAVDPSQLEISLLSPERGETVSALSPGAISTGTLDAIYLAARFCLVGLLGRGKGEDRGGGEGIIVLDDPLIALDKNRRALAYELIAEYARRYQILLFTFDREAARYSDKIIELPSVPSATRASAR